MSLLNKTLSVSTEVWEPRQLKTSLKLLKQADVYLQQGIKFSGVGVFHSRAEWVYAGLLEGRRDVLHYVPQPFRLQIGRYRYIPDFFLETQSGRSVIELKPRGEFDPGRQRALEQACAVQGMRFKVIDNESVLDDEITASRHWRMVRALLAAKGIETDVHQAQILHELSHGPTAVEDLLTVESPAFHDRLWLALYALLLRGQVTMVHNTPAVYPTSEVSLWHA